MSNIIEYNGKLWIVENDTMTELKSFVFDSKENDKTKDFTNKIIKVIEWLFKLIGINISLKKTNQDTRSIQANRALHLYCKQVAEMLNERDLSVTAVLKHDVQFNMLTVKEQLFKPILSALRGKESTTQMTSREIDDVYHVMNKALGERFGIHIPFPSIDSMIFEQNYKEN